MGLSVLAKIVTLLLLVAVFVGNVLWTPRIWKPESKADDRHGSSKA